MIKSAHSKTMGAMSWHKDFLNVLLCCLFHILMVIQISGCRFSKNQI